MTENKEDIQHYANLIQRAKLCSCGLCPAEVIAEVPIIDHPNEKDIYARFKNKKLMKELLESLDKNWEEIS